jgi:DNA-binding NarL/FixJ family response regulator
MTYLSLVDDHALLRSALASLINEFDGFQVLFEADHGKDFIRQLKAPAYPDIVLLDITMPEMNGYETALWIRANLPDTRVLVLSMMRDEAAVIRMLRYGARGYLLKDSRPEVFKTALRQVRDEGFYLNELVNPKLLYRLNSGSPEALLPHFTDRELAYLRLACSEKSHKDIAKDLVVSPRTVDSYRDSLFEKVGVNTRVGLVLFAIRNGLVGLEETGV